MMIGKFFIRFNLHNSICSFPTSFRILKPMVDISDSELEAYLEEIESTHISRAENLKSSHSKEAELLRSRKVLFIGDSITSDNLGYRLTVTVAAELNALDGSVSGGTTATVIHSSKTQISSFKPDLISIMMGSNDSVGVGDEGIRQVSIEEYERNLRAILKWSVESGAAILLFEIPPVHESRFKASFTSQYKCQSNDNIKKYNCILKNIANEYGIPLIPHSWLKDEAVDQLFESDGIHLSPQGQELFAKNWLTSAAKIINAKE